jgi:hypothetical protein
MATTSGLVIAVGEIFGGGLGPVLAGQMAQAMGIANLLRLPMGALVAGFLLALLLQETRRNGAAALAGGHAA